MSLSHLDRQFTMVYYQIQEALGQAMRQLLYYVLTLQHNSTLSTDKLSRMCVLFLQSTPPQNWILLSVYQNRSSSPYQDLCYACVILGTLVIISILFLHIYNITKPYFSSLFFKKKRKEINYTTSLYQCTEQLN